jgi:hypothetical protein
VLAARRLGAERIILMGRHTGRTGLGRQWGATDVMAKRGAEGIAKVLDLTGGDGTYVVVEVVGHRPAYDMAVGVVRVGGVISRVGVPQYEASRRSEGPATAGRSRENHPAGPTVTISRGRLRSPCSRRTAPPARHARWGFPTAMIALLEPLPASGDTRLATPSYS